MSGLSRRLGAALDAVGAQLKRDRKHLVFALPNGRTFVTSKSPSDTRNDDNAIADLAKVAGVALEERRKAPAEVRAERRRRPGRNGDAPWTVTPSPMAAALSNAGVVEARLRQEHETLRADILRARSGIDEQAATIRQRDARIAELEALWVVRAWCWLRGSK